MKIKVLRKSQLEISVKTIYFCDRSKFETMSSHSHSSNSQPDYHRMTITVIEAKGLTAADVNGKSVRMEKQRVN